MNPTPNGNPAGSAAAQSPATGGPAPAAAVSPVDRAAALDADVARLADQNARFLVILDAHPERISVVDPASHEVLFANRAYREALGQDPTGRTCFEVLHQLETPCDFCRGDILAQQPGVPLHWERHDARSGRDYDITDILVPWTDGRLVHYQLSADSTERKQLQRRLEENLRELARSNAELEQFAYLASHDLQEPLRKIQAFGERVAALPDGPLDDRGRDHLARMLESARRMQQLITDLLTYSRVGMQAQLFAEVDLADIARQVKSDLELRIEQTGGRVEVGELPPVEADPTQLRLLLQNLVGNALKFQRDGVPPVVRVSGREKGRHVHIEVADNGIGLDLRHRDRIFRIFQRLHTREEFEGTGLGLAVCEKIAQRHGGSIRVDSTPGEGATFTVTLPRRQVARKAG